MPELEKILNINEKILWKGKPIFWPFILGNIAISVFGIIWLGMFFPFIIVAMMAGAEASPIIGINPGVAIFLMPHFWVGILMTFGPIIYNLLVYKHVLYAITDRRVLLQTGVIGRDFQMIDFDKITNAEVNVGILDTILMGGKTGTIKISSAGTFVTTKNGIASKPYALANIESPYEIFKMLKGVSMDVKTDIEYPNKLRPSENPGYTTEYTPKK